MKTFTKEQNEMLKAQATEIMQKLDKGADVRDVMAEVYAVNMDNKTLQQGQLMADAILTGVKNFDASYREAQRDNDKFIDKFQAQVSEGKSCLENCNYWLKMSAGISAAEKAMHGEGADRETILSQLENLSIPEEEATPARERELREQAKLALKNSSVMLSALTEQAQAIQEMGSAEEATGMLIDLGNQEIEYRAVVAMLAYTKIKNGEFEDMPVDMTAAQVATVVCAQAEQTRIMAAVGSGSLAVDVASLLLFILGTVVLIQLAVVAGVVGVSFVSLASFMFGGILTIPASLVVMAGLLHLFSAAVKSWAKDSETIAKAVVAGVGWVVKGLMAVANFISTHVLPAVVRTASDIWSAIKAPFAQRPAETVEMPRVQ